MVPATTAAPIAPRPRAPAGAELSDTGRPEPLAISVASVAGEVVVVMSN